MEKAEVYAHLNNYASHPNWLLDLLCCTLPAVVANPKSMSMLLLVQAVS